MATVEIVKSPQGKRHRKRMIRNNERVVFRFIASRHIVRVYGSCNPSDPFRQGGLPRGWVGGFTGEGCYHIMPPFLRPDWFQRRRIYNSPVQVCLICWDSLSSWCPVGVWIKTNFKFKICMVMLIFGFLDVLLLQTQPVHTELHVYHPFVTVKGMYVGTDWPFLASSGLVCDFKEAPSLSVHSFLAQNEVKEMVLAILDKVCVCVLCGLISQLWNMFAAVREQTLRMRRWWKDTILC